MKVVNSSIVASYMYLPKTGFKKGISKFISGWNEHMQAQHDTSMFCQDNRVQCANESMMKLPMSAKCRYAV